MAKNNSTENAEPPSGYERLDNQISWYDQKSGSAQRLYKRTKIAEIVCAASIPVTALFAPWVASVLGAAVLIFEALQHLNQWQQLWNSYRSTCEALRHEKYTFLGRTGPYDTETPEEAKKLLVDRVESLISTEHSKWISNQETAAKALSNHAGKK